VGVSFVYHMNYDAPEVDTFSHQALSSPRFWGEILFQKSVYYSIPSFPLFYPLVFQISANINFLPIILCKFPKLNAQKKKVTQSTLNAAGGFHFTGVTLQNSKAVEPLDNQEVTMMCWLQYALSQFWAQLGWKWSKEKLWVGSGYEEMKFGMRL